MKTKEIRQLSVDDINLRIGEARQQIVEYRLQRATNKLTNLAVVRTARKTLARLLTIESEERKKSGK